eukprot:m.87873 g.87873  ORF g.87873 m.87873 type:complete len:520 (+) comp12253_c0_seq1:143-1702(+)
MTSALLQDENTNFEHVVSLRNRESIFSLSHQKLRSPKCSLRCSLLIQSALPLLRSNPNPTTTSTTSTSTTTIDSHPAMASSDTEFDYVNFNFNDSDNESNEGVKNGDNGNILNSNKSSHDMDEALDFSRENNEEEERILSDDGIDDEGEEDEEKETDKDDSGFFLDRTDSEYGFDEFADDDFDVEFDDTGLFSQTSPILSHIPATSITANVSPTSPTLVSHPSSSSSSSSSNMKRGSNTNPHANNNYSLSTEDMFLSTPLSATSPTFIPTHFSLCVGEVLDMDNQNSQHHSLRIIDEDSSGVVDQDDDDETSSFDSTSSGSSSIEEEEEEAEDVDSGNRNPHRMTRKKTHEGDAFRDILGDGLCDKNSFNTTTFSPHSSKGWSPTTSTASPNKPRCDKSNLQPFNLQVKEQEEEQGTSLEKKPFSPMAVACKRSFSASQTLFDFEGLLSVVDTDTSTTTLATVNGEENREEEEEEDVSGGNDEPPFKTSRPSSPHCGFDEYASPPSSPLVTPSHRVHCV